MAVHDSGCCPYSDVVHGMVFPAFVVLQSTYSCWCVHSQVRAKQVCIPCKDGASLLHVLLNKLHTHCEADVSVSRNTSMGYGSQWFWVCAQCLVGCVTLSSIGLNCTFVLVVSHSCKSSACQGARSVYECVSCIRCVIRGLCLHCRMLNSIVYVEYLHPQQDDEIIGGGVPLAMAVVCVFIVCTKTTAVSLHTSNQGVWCGAHGGTNPSLCFCSSTLLQAVALNACGSLEVV